MMKPKRPIRASHEPAAEVPWVEACSSWPEESEPVLDIYDTKQDKGRRSLLLKARRLLSLVAVIFIN